MQMQFKGEEGLTLTRAIKCLARGQNDIEHALHFAKNMYLFYDDVADCLKALDPMTKDIALNATIPSEGGFLVPQDFSDGLIPSLQANTAAFKLGARPVPMPFGNISFPRITGNTNSQYLGENTAPTVSAATFGDIRMSSKKLMTLVPISNDLLRNSTIGADLYLRDEIVRSQSLKIDYSVMFGTGTAYTPLGIKESIVTANRTVATGSGTLSGDTPGDMISILMALNIPFLSPGFIIAPETWHAFFNMKTTTNSYVFRPGMEQGKLAGYPFVVSSQITSANSTASSSYRNMFFGDFSELLMGDKMGFNVDVAQNADWLDGATMRSAFSEDQTIVRVINEHDIALRHNSAFVVYDFPTS